MMLSLGQYVLRGYKQAAWVALLCALLPYFTSLGLLISWLGPVIMALVTLRKGVVEGLVILFWVALPSLVMSITGHVPVFLSDVLCGSLVVWILAVVLRLTASWMWVFYTCALLGFIGIVALHWWIADLPQFWETSLLRYLQQVNEQFGLYGNANDVKQIAHGVAQYETQLQAIVVLLGNLGKLWFARWWQALLFNPGGLRQELYRLQVNYWAVLLLLVMFIVALLGNGVAMDALPLALMPFCLVGVSIVHYFVAQGKSELLRLSWLCLFYMLWLFFFPYIIGLLVAVACIDIRWNLRQRWTIRPS